jgi:prevent-host-death family protein
MSKKPQEISAADFKAKCLKLMDNVEQQRTEIVITKRGRPVAKLVPYNEEPPRLFGYMAGTITILGDIMAPLDEVWNAEHE